MNTKKFIACFLTLTLLLSGLGIVNSGSVFAKKAKTAFKITKVKAKSDNLKSIDYSIAIKVTDSKKFKNSKGKIEVISGGKTESTINNISLKKANSKKYTTSGTVTTKNIKTTKYKLKFVFSGESKTSNAVKVSGKVVDKITSLTTSLGNKKGCFEAKALFEAKNATLYEVRKTNKSFKISSINGYNKTKSPKISKVSKTMYSAEISVKMNNKIDDTVTVTFCINGQKKSSNPFMVPRVPNSEDKKVKSVDSVTASVLTSNEKTIPVKVDATFTALSEFTSVIVKKRASVKIKNKSNNKVLATKSFNLESAGINKFKISGTLEINKARIKEDCTCFAFVSVDRKEGISPDFNISASK